MLRTKHTKAERIEALKQMEAGRELRRPSTRSTSGRRKGGGTTAREAEKARWLREGTQAAAETSGGPEPGRGDAAGGDPKKRL